MNMKTQMTATLSGLFLIAILAVWPAHADDMFYDVDPDTAAIDGGTGNWDDLNWKYIVDDVFGDAWWDGSRARFAPIVGTPATTTITISDTVSAAGVYFEGAGYTIEGGTLGIDAGNWYEMDNSGTVSSELSGALQVRGAAGAELVVSGGGTISGRGVLGDGGTAGTLRQTAGDIVIGSDWLMVGGNGVANSQGHYIMDGGSLTIEQGIYLGWKGNGSEGTFTQNGGTVTTQSNNQGISLGIEGGTGNYNLNGGTLVSTFGRYGEPYSGTFTFGGGTFQARAAFDTGWQSGVDTSIADGATANIDTQGSTVTWSTALTGASANGLVKSGTGILVLSGANSYAGDTTLNAGTVRLGNATALGNSTGTISVNRTNPGVGDTKTSLDLRGYSISNPIVIGARNPGVSDGGALQNTLAESTSVLSGTVSIGGENYGGGNGNITFDGVVSGAASYSNSYSLYKPGTGTWKFANTANTFDGFYYHIGGTTEVTKLANINEASSLGQPTTSTANRFSFGIGGGGGGTLRFVGEAASSSDRVFILQGATAAASNTIAADGATAADTLTLTGGLAAGRAGDYTLALGGDNTGDNEYAGVIANGSGTVGLAKQGAGKWILSGANTYSGATTVEGGTLVVDGSLTSAVTVADGATLGGSGIFNAGISLSAGATLEPGNSPGSMTLGGDLTMDGAELVIDIWGLGGAGSDHDIINFTAGALSLLNAPSIVVDLNNSFDPDPATSFTIIDGFSDWSGAFGDISVRNAPASWLSSGKTFEVGEGSVVLTVIPEPGTLGLLLLGVSAMILKRRGEKS
jgi:autotransporter-associated beta strand protein